ncbi:MAG TPA: hypothetical protein VGQ11_05970 [Candidatus Acidoferrales bacterium]|jgi:hypothetical protein|nr:hypothetical protein [Candidatus Acidoferrales bacterium]
MSVYSTSPLSLEKIRTYPLARRKSKVTVREFARVPRRGASVRELMASLPRILAADDFRAILAALHKARAQRRPILWGLGGHVIKVGLAPILINLIRRGYVTGMAMNGAALVHDFEIALVGNTSEDVDAVLGRGQFGMAEETGLYLNEIAVGAARAHIGLGEAAGKLLTNKRLGAKFLQHSVLVAAYRARVPVTVHLAIGTDIPHMHRSADGAALGAATHHDFRLFCALVKRMHPGGVYLNWGSAVILPEVFLKAVSVAQNLGTPLRGITTANFDFIQHYRPQQNVLMRPTRSPGSRGFAITGHHELLLPLLSAAL